MTGIWCLGGCNTKIAPEILLCTSCRNELEKYGDKNPDTIAKLTAWADANPLADLERLLAAHAAFDLYLTEHPYEEDKTL